MYYTILGRVEVKEGRDGKKEAVVNQYHSTVVHQSLYDVDEFLQIVPKVCKGVSNALTVQLFEGTLINRSQERVVLGGGFFLEDGESAKASGVHQRPVDSGEFQSIG